MIGASDIRHIVSTVDLDSISLEKLDADMIKDYLVLNATEGWMDFTAEEVIGLNKFVTHLKVMAYILQANK
jgi:hypothetical protein